MSFLHVDHVTHTYFSIKEKRRPYGIFISMPKKVISFHFSAQAAAEKQHCFPLLQA